MSSLESFKMIANGVSKFLSFSLQLAIAWYTLFILKSRALSKICCFYPKNEVIAFPKSEI